MGCGECCHLGGRKACRFCSAQGRKLGVLKDIGKMALADGEDVEELEHYLKEVSEHQAPYGLHTFGVAPPKEMQRSTAEAILALAGKLAPAEYQRRLEALMANMEASGKAELDALEAGLAGRYVAAGPGNDPIRNPDSLPTGRNLYGFDPSRIPTPQAWAAGKEALDGTEYHYGEFGKDVRVDDVAITKETLKIAQDDYAACM